MLAGLFATEWAAARFGRSPVDRRRPSLTFPVLAVLLLAAFLVVDGATFDSGSSASSS